MLIRIDAIATNGNLRRTPATPAQDAALRTSLQVLGQAQPILVRPSEEPGHTHVLVAGRRRLEAMCAIGHEEIEAFVLPVTEKVATALQGAENMVRAGMDPVDQWLAIRTLQDQGYALLQAGQALGLADRQTRRLHVLAGLAPELLDALRGRPLPHERLLGVIAAASHVDQVAAWQMHGYAHGVDWPAMADRLITTRIPLARALFAADGGGVVFDEDLFAEPGSAEQWTTGDVSGFLAAQSEALRLKIENTPEPAAVSPYNRVSGLPEAPKGWVFVHGVPDGKALPRKGKRKRLWSIVPAIEHDRAGTVICAVIEPDPAHKPAEAPAAATHEPDAPDAVQDVPPAGPGPDEADPDGDAAAIGEELLPITKVGQRILARARTEALCAALAEPGVDVREMLALMVLACCAENGLGGSSWGGTNGRYDALAAALLSPSGQLLVPDDDTLLRIAGSALARTLVVASTADQKSATTRGSGAAAEWIGCAVSADTCMPRLDRFEFLDTVQLPMLRSIAATHGITGVNKATDLRARLVDHAPDFLPVSFGAPAPRVAPWQPPVDETEKGDAT